MRIELAEASFGNFEVAKLRDDWGFFINTMQQLNRRYHRAYLGPVKANLLYRLIVRGLRGVRNIAK